MTPLLFAMDSSVAAVHVSLRARARAVGVGDDDSRDLRVPCFNAHPHVTVWIAEPGLARYSNELLGTVVPASGGLIAGGQARGGVDEGFVVPLGGREPKGPEPGAELGGEAPGDARSGSGRVTVRGRVEFFW